MKWIDKCYSRLLIDNHITDQKPEFMRDYDPLRYAAMVELSGVDSSMVYACDHNGNCYYPTKVGHIHANLAGRDLFGEVVSHLRKRSIAPIAYYTVIYHNDAARRFPGAVIIDPVGRTHDGRHHYVCPNHPEVVEFFKAQIAEILAYEIQGIFIDMSFWPSICRCEGCRRKFGKPVPEIIDWSNPAWVEFQRFREETMAQFAQELTDWCRTLRPDITVTHQFSPVLHGWALGQSSGIARASDYASGDFYGNKLQQCFAVKVFDAFTPVSAF